MDPIIAQKQLEETIDCLTKKISQLVNNVRKTEYSTGKLYERQQECEHNIKVIQRESRFTNKKTHNLRKEGHIVIAKLKQDLQKERNTEDKLQQNLSSKQLDLKKLKQNNTDALKSIEDKIISLTEMKALNQQKKSDIKRMDGLINQQQKKMNSHLEENKELSRNISKQHENKPLLNNCRVSKPEQNVQQVSVPQVQTLIQKQIKNNDSPYLISQPSNYAKENNNNNIKENSGKKIFQGQLIQTEEDKFNTKMTHKDEQNTTKNVITKQNNKALAKKYGEEIKQKVNALNSIVDKISKDSSNLQQ